MCAAPALCQDKERGETRCERVVSHDPYLAAGGRSTPFFRARLLPTPIPACRRPVPPHTRPRTVPSKLSSPPRRGGHHRPAGAPLQTARPRDERCRRALRVRTLDVCLPLPPARRRRPARGADGRQTVFRGAVMEHDGRWGPGMGAATKPTNDPMPPATTPTMPPPPAFPQTPCAPTSVSLETCWTW